MKLLNIVRYYYVIKPGRFIIMEYCIENYISNNNPGHHDDQHYKDEGQKEVYEFCRAFMKKLTLKNYRCRMWERI